MLPFFTRGPSYRPILHKEIFQLVYAGNGGFTWEAVYHMPVWLRRFYIKELREITKEEPKLEKELTNKYIKKEKIKSLERPVPKN